MNCILKVGTKMECLSTCLTLLLLFPPPAIYAYDPLDPMGNITIRWDVLQQNDYDGTQDVRLWILNNQLFRHIEFPGWKLSWRWAGDEVILSMLGAESTEQGDCPATLRARQMHPHSCEKEPVIIDLLPGAPDVSQLPNCCKAGLLSSIKQHPANHIAVFQMHLGINASSISMPGNFSLGVPGYTCGHPFQVPPTKFIEDQGRRRTQAIATWNVGCSYSQFKASHLPTCCVSLSSFYNKAIVPCPKCSCACQAQSPHCVKGGKHPPKIRVRHPVVQCSDHMCPIKVHWHVKQSYREYWSVKITISNLNYGKNYSDWNLEVVHPNLRNVSRILSFNYKPLNLYGNINDTGMVYGVEHYNDVVEQCGENGNVQIEMLLHKDGAFTFTQGWGFPRKIAFNGDECVMPSPHHYPTLPNHAPSPSAILLFIYCILVLIYSYLLFSFLPLLIYS